MDCLLKGVIKFLVFKSRVFFENWANETIKQTAFTVLYILSSRTNYRNAWNNWLQYIEWISRKIFPRIIEIPDQKQNKPGETVQEISIFVKQERVSKWSNSILARRWWWWIARTVILTPFVDVTVYLFFFLCLLLYVKDLRQADRLSKVSYHDRMKKRCLRLWLYLFCVAGRGMS